MVQERVLAAMVILPYVFGWLVGGLLRGSLWVLAALVAGYRAGRGDEGTN